MIDIEWGASQLGQAGDKKDHQSQGQDDQVGVGGLGSYNLAQIEGLRKDGDGGGDQHHGDFVRN